MLKPSKDPLGYTSEEISKICKERKISSNKFWEAFGINTVAISKDGSYRYYRCDVEKALWTLKHKDGKFHLWD